MNLCSEGHYHFTQNEITIGAVKQLTRNEIFSYFSGMGFIRCLAQLTIQHPPELVEFSQMQEG